MYQLSASLRSPQITPPTDHLSLQTLCLSLSGLPFCSSLLPPTSPHTHFKFFSFLPSPSALTAPSSSTLSQISDLHPAQNGFPSGLTKPSPLQPTLHPIPSVLAFPLLLSPSCFALLPTTSFGYWWPKSNVFPCSFRSLPSPHSQTH